MGPTLRDRGVGPASKTPPPVALLAASTAQISCTNPAEDFGEPQLGNQTHAAELTPSITDVQETSDGAIVSHPKARWRFPTAQSISSQPKDPDLQKVCRARDREVAQNLLAQFGTRERTSDGLRCLEISGLISHELRGPSVGMPLAPGGACTVCDRCRSLPVW